MKAPEIKARLDALAVKISNQITRADEAKTALEDADQELANIASEEADLIAAIGLLAPGTAFNDLCINELAEMTATFTAERTRVQAGAAAL